MARALLYGSFFTILSQNLSPGLGLVITVLFRLCEERMS